MSQWWAREGAGHGSDPGLPAPDNFRGLNNPEVPFHQTDIFAERVTPNISRNTMPVARDGRAPGAARTTG